MAIIQRLVCKCAVCAHEWIPAKTKDNPDTDPAKVKRCAACKSARWNANAGDTFPAPGTGERSLEATNTQLRADRAREHIIMAAATCRHRILVKDCRLCAPVTQ